MAKIKTKFITDLAVTSGKLAAASVTSAKLANDLALPGNPTAATQSFGDNTTKIATTAFVQAAAEAAKRGQTTKDAVRLIATVDTALTGGATLTIDSVSAANGDRVALIGQTAGAENGLYLVSGIGSTYALTRTVDADASSEVKAGMTFWVTEGTVYADTGFELLTNDPITLDTTSLSFTQYTGTAAITAGTGLTKTGNTLDVGAGDGISVAADSVTVNIDGTTLSKSGSGLKVASGGITNTEVNASAAIAYSKLALSNSIVAGDLTSNSVTTAKITDANVTAAKLASDVAGAGLTSTSGVLAVVSGNTAIVANADDITLTLAASSGLEISSGLKAKVDAATVKVNGSGQLQGLIPTKESFTLGAGDITNQYVDLANIATASSIRLFVVGGPEQVEGSDYTVSLTGGAGGMTRLTFAGDLATAGDAELVATDIVKVAYSHI